MITQDDPVKNCGVIIKKTRQPSGKNVFPDIKMNIE